VQFSTDIVQIHDRVRTDNSDKFPAKDIVGAEKFNFALRLRQKKLCLKFCILEEYFPTKENFPTD